MSSNRTRLPALALLTGLALAAAGCATPAKYEGRVEAAITPTEQYPLETVGKPEEVLLAPHPYGLSENQAGALRDFAANWRDRGDGAMVIEAPSGGDAAASTAYAARDALESFGVPRKAINLVGAREGLPVRVSFLVLEAKVPECGKSWDDLTHSGSNAPSKTFGCAVNANLASMIANPADIDRPAAEEPVDAGRRQVVIDKYRAGAKTSSEQDENAKGAISRAVQ